MHAKTTLTVIFHRFHGAPVERMAKTGLGPSGPGGRCRDRRALVQTYLADVHAETSFTTGFVWRGPGAIDPGLVPADIHLGERTALGPLSSYGPEIKIDYATWRLSQAGHRSA